MTYTTHAHGIWYAAMHMRHGHGRVGRDMGMHTWTCVLEAESPLASLVRRVQPAAPVCGEPAATRREAVPPRRRPLPQRTPRPPLALLPAPEPHPHEYMHADGATLVAGHEPGHAQAMP